MSQERDYVFEIISSFTSYKELLAQNEKIYNLAERLEREGHEDDSKMLYTQAFINQTNAKDKLIKILNISIEAENAEVTIDEKDYETIKKIINEAESNIEESMNPRKTAKNVIE